MDITTGDQEFVGPAQTPRIGSRPQVQQLIGAHQPAAGAEVFEEAGSAQRIHRLLGHTDRDAGARGDRTQRRVDQLRCVKQYADNLRALGGKRVTRSIAVQSVTEGARLCGHS
ncbi:Uncharacterised protein [Mycobacterium tuberculosis]|uniref:Uncharacterized protein n=1 Tax=Mycobacterium tuberculosis TaxID=1773 RepID=A0A655CNR9_MYCTX|nr:Uncharacterised protein [Mycobacterium tuberculosis]CNW87091.1 Uncharacterised protein [Mycobacterium tuberculosis]